MNHGVALGIEPMALLRSALELFNDIGEVRVH